MSCSRRCSTSKRTKSRADDRRGLSTSTRLELALAGLGQRLRARPPLRTRMRLVRGRGELTWEGLAWLRDILDQRGHALRTVAFAVLMLVTVQLGQVCGTSPTPKASFPQSGCSLRSPSCCYLSWSSSVSGGSTTALRSRAMRRAGLTHWGWPVAWNPPPPTWAMSTSPLGATSTRRDAPVVPPATRWVTGELRLVLATCTVGGVLSSASAYVLYARNSRPATPFGYAFAPHVYDLAPVVFLVAALCGIAGTFVARRVARRARTLFRPEARPRSLVDLPVEAPDAIVHTLSSAERLCALLGILAPMVPVWGRVLGGFEVLAVPVLIVLLATIRCVERETGVAVHQRQVAAAIGGRYWRDRWAPVDTVSDAAATLN